MNHRQTHPTPVEGCFGCKLLTVNTSRGPTPTDIREKALSADLDAYKRLRRNGLQPPHIDGSAEAEKRVGSQWDFDLGRLVPKAEMSRVLEGAEVAKDMGFG